jgi:hypothetical protein
MVKARETPTATFLTLHIVEQMYADIETTFLGPSSIKKLESTLPDYPRLADLKVSFAGCSLIFGPNNEHSQAAEKYAMILTENSSGNEAQQILVALSKFTSRSLIFYYSPLRPLKN